MELTKDYIEKYEAALEQKIMDHFTFNPGYLKLKSAYEYLKTTVDALFGTEQHLGLVQFFLDQKSLNLELDAAVSRAEKMLERGWSIKQENNRAYVLNESLQVVAEVSGPTNILVEDLEITVEDAYKFLSEQDAKLLVSAAHKKGEEISQLKSPEFTYAFIENKLGVEHDLFPLAQSYSGLGKITKKLDSFTTVGEFKSLKDLYTEGFRLSSDLNPTSLARTLLSKGTKSFILRPVIHEYDLATGKYIDQLALEKLKDKTSFYKKVGIDVEIPVEIATMNQTYALAFEVQSDFRTQDAGDLFRMFSAGTVSKGLKDKLMTQFAMYYLTELLVYKSNKISFADFYIDTLSGNLTKRFNPSAAILTDEEILEMLENTTKESFKSFKLMSVDVKDAEFRTYVGELISLLPANYKNAITSVNFAAKDKLLGLL